MPKKSKRAIQLEVKAKHTSAFRYNPASSAEVKSAKSYEQTCEACGKEFDLPQLKKRLRAKCGEAGISTAQKRSSPEGGDSTTDAQLAPARKVDIYILKGMAPRRSGARLQTIRGSQRLAEPSSSGAAIARSDGDCNPNANDIDKMVQLADGELLNDLGATEGPEGVEARERVFAVGALTYSCKNMKLSDEEEKSFMFNGATQTLPKRSRKGQRNSKKKHMCFHGCSLVRGGTRQARTSRIRGPQEKQTENGDA